MADMVGGVLTMAGDVLTMAGDMEIEISIKLQLNLVSDKESISKEIGSFLFVVI
jgi:hypothetical protein